MIISFADTATEDIYHGTPSKKARRFSAPLIAVACRKLDMINSANNLQDLRSPPGNRLEALKGIRSGFHSIRINDQYRIVFQFSEGNASKVTITDYH